MTQTTAFVLTLLIEIPIVVGVVRLSRWAPGALGRVALLAVGASLLTHPLLWLARDHVQTLPSLLLAELLITLIEALVYALAGGLGFWRGLLLSALANGASFGAGLATQFWG